MSGGTSICLVGQVDVWWDKYMSGGTIRCLVGQVDVRWDK